METHLGERPISTDKNLPSCSFKKAQMRSIGNNFVHQLGNDWPRRLRVIVFEDLSTKKLVHNHCLAKSTSDAA
jgi:hypothetical protein